MEEKPQVLDFLIGCWTFLLRTSAPWATLSTTRTTLSTLAAGPESARAATLSATAKQLTAIKLERVAEQHSPFISLCLGQGAFDAAIPLGIKRGTIFF
jgi:hypothetical protein